MKVLAHVLVKGFVKNWEASETLPYLQANELDPPLFQSSWKKTPDLVGQS